MFILIILPDVWAAVVRSKQALFEYLIPVIVRKRFLVSVDTVFQAVVCAEFDVFVAAISAVISGLNSRDCEFVARLFEWISRVALNHFSIVGSRGTLAIAALGCEYSTFSNLTSRLLRAHISALENVACSGEVLAIGTNDGVLHLFRQGKQYHHRIVSGPIDVVSVDPTGRYASALSYETLDVHRVEVPRNGLICLRRALRTPLDGDRTARYELGWSDDARVIVKRIRSA
jgi:hypothetical protein